MASNPLFIIPDFFLHFPNEFCYGYPRFEGNGKTQKFYNQSDAIKEQVPEVDRKRQWVKYTVQSLLGQ